MNLFQLLANVTNDGKHPLLEFAMKFFREGKNFEAVLSDSTNEPNEPQKEKKKANENPDLIRITARNVEQIA